MRRLLLAIAALFCIAAAGDPSERLPDPAQEARARALFAEFRCVVCQNESIDDSDAEVAGLLRRTVREQVAAGRTDAEVRTYLVDRYGEFVLLKPTFSAGNAVLWLLPLALLAAAYPLRAWRDAPLFPTEADALEGLETLVPLPPMARVLDAGCGLGHGLQALQKVWPDARMEGIEWSWPIRLAAGLRCPWARIRQGDMWAASWAEHDLVYLFQRPESMNRAAEKALAEMRPGGWLVSLEFDVPGMRPHARLQNEGHRPVWIYAIR